jgi:hypothetical protein
MAHGDGGDLPDGLGYKADDRSVRRRSEVEGVGGVGGVEGKGGLRGKGGKRMGGGGGDRKNERLEREAKMEKRYREVGELLSCDLKKGRVGRRVPTLTDDFFGKNLTDYIGDTLIQSILGVRPRPKPRQKKNVSNFEKHVAESRPSPPGMRPPQLITPSKTNPGTPVNQPRAGITRTRASSMNSIPAEPALQKDPSKLSPSNERPSEVLLMHLPIHTVLPRANTVMQVPQEIPEDPQEHQDDLEPEDLEIARQEAELAAYESQYTSSSDHTQPILTKGGLCQNNLLARAGSYMSNLDKDDKLDNNDKDDKLYKLDQDDKLYKLGPKEKNRPSPTNLRLFPINTLHEQAP